MSLEGVTGEEVKRIMASLKELNEAREINIKDANKTLSNVEKAYNALLKEEGQDYCNENCPDAPVLIKRMRYELNSGFAKIK